MAVPPTCSHNRDKSAMAAAILICGGRARRRAGRRFTLLALTSKNMVNAALSDRLSFSLNRDFAMVAGLNRSP